MTPKCSEGEHKSVEIVRAYVDAYILRKRYGIPFEENDSITIVTEYRKDDPRWCPLRKEKK